MFGGKSGVQQARRPDFRAADRRTVRQPVEQSTGCFFVPTQIDGQKNIRSVDFSPKREYSKGHKWRKVVYKWQKVVDKFITL